MNEIWAKSKKIKNDQQAITLQAHTLGLLQQLEVLKQDVKIIEEYYEMIKLAIVLHDLGKVSPSFQLSLRNWDYLPKFPFPDVPHSLFSLLWIDEDKLKLKIPDEKDGKILLSAVAFHHWRGNFENIVLGKDKEFKRAVKLIIEDNTLKERLLKNLKDNLVSIDSLDILNFNEDIAISIKEGEDLFSYIIPPYFAYFLPQRLFLQEEDKKEWIYIAGNLMRIDHFTSFIQEEDLSDKIEITPPEICIVRKNIKNKIGKTSDDDIWQIKELSRSQDSSIILVAPTGCGKTEFAFLWGAENKILFTLPLRSATNSIFERANAIFGDNNVGLLHSDADIYLYENLANNEGEFFRILEMARQLSLPALVSTGDQIFPAALKYPGYEKVYATLGYSRLIIDEVQSYDPRAVAIIVNLIEDITKLGGKFLLMTATLPSFVEEEIEKRVREIEKMDKYHGLEGIQKHKIQTINEDIEKREVIEKICETANSGKRVLVILNTVEKTQKVFKEIQNLMGKEKDVYLLHSRFTISDRNAKEQEIVEGKFKNPKLEIERESRILVATQVVEASLDIDADVLYTELAPIDSLVQRMGRVLRRIKAEHGKCYHHNEEPNIIVYYNYEGRNSIALESGKGKVYETELLALSLGLLLKEVGVISDEDWKKLIDEWKLKDFISAITEANRKQSPCLFLSEIQKKELVNELYKNLPQTSSYLSKFYDTLEILDAGYMSEKKNEALRLFREIYTAPAITSDMIPQFKKSLENFLKQADFSYTAFKRMVISKYVVNVNIKTYKTAEYLVYEIQSEDEKKIERMKKWLRDIYIVEDFEYDQTLGLINQKGKRKW